MYWRLQGRGGGGGGGGEGFEHLPENNKMVSREEGARFRRSNGKAGDLSNYALSPESWLRYLAVSY